MKKLLTRLLLLFTALSILLLSGYTQSYADRYGETSASSSINIKDQVYADFGGLKISQSFTFKAISSTSGKEKVHFKIDPAEVEEDELNSYSKYLTGSRYFTFINNIEAPGDYFRHLLGNRYSTLFPTHEKHIVLQVFRI